MNFILALDQGTTSSRAMVFDHEGAVRAMAQREFAQHFPQSGWVEHDAIEIWQGQIATAREAMSAAACSASSRAAVTAASPPRLWPMNTTSSVSRAR